MANKKQPPKEVAAMMQTAEAQANAAFGKTHTPYVAPASASPDEFLQDCTNQPETDIGNGRRFLIRYGDRVLFVARVGWHGYDGKRWKEDEDGSVIRPFVQNAAELIIEEATLLTASEEEQKHIENGIQAKNDKKKLGKPLKDWTPEQHERYWQIEETISLAEDAKKSLNGRKSARHRHAKSSASTSKINNMLTEAQPFVAKMVTDLNKDLYALNTNSGTLRFYSEPTGKKDQYGKDIYKWHYRIDKHEPSDLISKLCPTIIDESAKAVEWDKFLKTVQPDADIRLFLQRFMGYCLTALTVEQCLLFFYGAGRNGKSTFLDAIGHVMGDYSITLSIDSFAGDNRRGGAEATPDLARLPGARLVSASEPEMGVKLKDSLIKTLTGGEIIPVRRLHEDFFEVHPHFKIILSGNHKPRIDDTSDGIWRRMFLVPWEVQIAKQDVDRNLPEKLKKETAGILKWMLDGAIEYLEYGLNPPEAVMLATAEYREENDPIGAFIRTACLVTGSEHDIVPVGDLYAAYCVFASKEGAAEFRQTTFSKRIPDKTRLSWQGTDGQMKQFWKGKRSVTVYMGLQVKDEFKPKAEVNYP